MAGFAKEHLSDSEDGIYVEIHTFDDNTVIDYSEQTKSAANGMEEMREALKTVVKTSGEPTTGTSLASPQTQVEGFSGYKNNGKPIDVTAYVKSLLFSSATGPPYDTISLELALPTADAGHLAKLLMSDTQGGCVVIRRRGSTSNLEKEEWPAIAWGFIDNVSYGASVGQAGGIQSMGVSIQTVSWFQYLRYTRPMVDIFQAAQNKNEDGTAAGGHFRIGTLFSLASWYQQIVMPMLQGMMGVRVNKLASVMLRVLGTPQLPKSLCDGEVNEAIGEQIYIYRNMGPSLDYNHALSGNTGRNSKYKELWADRCKAIHPKTRKSVPIPPPGARVVVPPGIAILNLGDWKQTSSVHDMIRQNFATDDAIVEMFPSLVPLDGMPSGFEKNGAHFAGANRLTPLGRGLNAVPTLVYRFVPDSGDTYEGEMAHYLVNGPTRCLDDDMIHIDQVLSFNVTHSESSRMNVFVANFPLAPDSDIKYKGTLPIYVGDSMKRFGCRVYEPNYTFAGIPHRQKGRSVFAEGMNDRELKTLAYYLVKHGKIDEVGSPTSVTDATTQNEIAVAVGDFGGDAAKSREKRTKFMALAKEAHINLNIKQQQHVTADSSAIADIQSFAQNDTVVADSLIFAMLRQVNEFSSKVHFFGPTVGTCTATVAYTPELQAGMHVKLYPFPKLSLEDDDYGAKIDDRYQFALDQGGASPAGFTEPFEITGYCNEVRHRITVNGQGGITKRTELTLARARTWYGWPTSQPAFNIDFRRYTGVSEAAKRNRSTLDIPEAGD